jgi:two-component system sensor histidine kinase HydH
MSLQSDMRSVPWWSWTGGVKDASRRNHALVVALLVATIMAGHYSLDPSVSLYHDVLRRCMYIPIILAGVWFGTFGGVATALVAAVLYAPHLILQLQLPRPEELDRMAEMVLYVVIGGLTGLLAERERWQREQTEDALARLRRAHDDLRQQSQRLTEIQEGLRQVERLSTLGELAADLAHEIRNPLAALRGTVQILAAEFSPDHRKHEFAEMVLAELDRLNGVLEGYLQVARSHARRGGCSDAVAALRTVAELVQQQAQRHHVTIECHGADRLPVLMDDGQLTQVFMNLTLNGIQAMPDGGLLRIECRALPAADGQQSGEISFQDTGGGIAGEHRARVFQPFFTTKPGGTGLGLNIARRLVEEHDGTLTLDATGEAGTVFRIRLPLAATP